MNPKNKIYEKYMRQCIRLARKSEGQVSPNPLVGAIILDSNGETVGSGRHEKYGEAHAEVNAINEAGEKARGGTIIVNLEPCSHFGKTPPCADLIIKYGLKKVVIGCVDPNPEVSGNGIKKLKHAGIEVETGVLEKECKALNEIFFKNQIQSLPFIAIKTATTMDGKIATKTGSSKWITGEKARADVQRIRNKYDAILTGSNTIEIDNPSLTCRKPKGRNPIRIIVDSKLKTNPKSKVYNDDGIKIYVAIGKDIAPKGFSENIEFIKCPLINEKIDLNFLTLKLYEKEIRSVLIEAGADLNGAFIKAKLVDKIYHYIAPKILGDKDAKNFIEGFNINNINECLKLALKSVKKLDSDILTESYIQSI